MTVENDWRRGLGNSMQRKFYNTCTKGLEVPRWVGGFVQADTSTALP